MKKTFLGLFLLAAIGSQAQTNLQVHYDFGQNRKYVTTTLEMFKPDKWGNTFFFVDYDFNYGNDKHPSMSYMEIARCINTWGGPFSAHIEYNGGLGGGPLGAGASYSYAINNAWLGGVDYGMHNADYSHTLNLKALYKHIVGKQESAQFTAVWGLHFMDRKISFTGFADIWLEDNTNTDGSKTNYTFISEPQLWYNFTSNISAGSEVELSSNFAGNHGFMVNPTLAVKWNF
jgi:hypothetical protein